MKIIYVIAAVTLIFSLSGCKVCRSVGESLGVIDEKTEEVVGPAPNSGEPNVPDNKVVTTTSVNYGALLLWLSLVAGVLVGARYWLKSYEAKGKKGARGKK